MNIKKTKNLKATLSVVALVLLISIVGLTSAYFVAGIQGDTTTDVTVTTGGVPELVFTKDGDLLIEATSENFVQGNGSLTSTVNTTATLTATGAYSTTYGLFFNVVENEFTYSTEEEYPELLLKVIGSDNTEITSIDGLVYKTYGDQSGFDVTTLSTGTITLLDNIAITTDGNTPTVDEYTVTLTFVNLDANQNNNSNKVFDAQVIMGDSSTTSDDDNNGDEATTVIPGELNSCGENITYSVCPVVMTSGNIEEVILANNCGTSVIESKEDPNFACTAVNNEGMFAYDDNYGTTYYYRGAIDNNWLKFGTENGQDIWWRIMRINGDGTIRIIYSGTTAPDASQSVAMTGDSTSINSATKISSYLSSAEYTGYMYTVGENHGNSNDSILKSVADAWYESNLSSYSEYISHNTSFCYSRTAYSDTYGSSIASGTGSSTQYFKSLINLYVNKTPSLLCDNVNDYYTVGEANNGNNALTSPIGIITADEASIAGAVYNSNNVNYYLYTNTAYWLMSPFNFSYSPSVLNISVTSGMRDMPVHAQYGARVVISLKNDINVTGSGSYNDPYIVVS